ncbi:choice-of-anchor Q domain-containing protein [Dokdonella sp. MW10]|uniref:choice-of-anchor Q domain-containing protein n=1 Tax=Dokdonella sp. MW10 TaxID=2992926 RepID=UPI003F821088
MLRHVVVGLFLAMLALDAQAATFQVTRIDDPAPGACVPGDCSLREAMDAAAVNDPAGEVDVITVPSGSIVLTRGSLVAVAQKLRVQGAGSGSTRIVLDEASTKIFRTAAGGELTAIGMTLDVAGGAVDGCHDGYQGVPVSIDDVVIVRGSITVCGTTRIRRSEIRTKLYANYGDTLVEDSAMRDFVMQGGGTSQLTMRRVLLDGSIDPDNTYPPQASVIRGTLLMEDSTITHTEFWLQGVGPSVMTLRRVHYIDNIGPIRTESTALMTIEDSLFENNTVRALYVASDAEWNISGSTFVNNSVNGNAGGAIVLEDEAILRIRNSTFSGNTFSVAAAGDGARGGAIGFRNGAGAQLILTHVTLARPAFAPVGIVGTVLGGHGNGVALSLSNSIVQGTCGMNAIVLQNQAGNIESGGDTCGLDPETNRVNVSTTSLALGALADNGGPTPTRLPATGSVSIDRGSTPQCLPKDQRGYARPGGVRCDVGAVEADASDRLFANGFES